MTPMMPIDTDDNTTRRTEHDCIGSLPNEPKSRQNIYNSNWSNLRLGVHDATYF